MRRTILCLVLTCGISSLRADVILDFDSLPDSTSITTQFQGIVFSNATVATAGISVDEFDFPPHSGSNVIFDDGGPMAISFLTPVDGFGGYFTYLGPLTLEAFDASQNLIGTAHSAFFNNTGTQGDAGSSPNEFLDITTQVSIAQIIITGDPSGFSFTLDDAAISTLSSTVPEPTSFSLLLAAAAGLARFASRKFRSTPGPFNRITGGIQ